MCIKNTLMQWFGLFLTGFVDFWDDERGYYYVEYKEDAKGDRQFYISPGIVYMLIACLTLLSMTVLWFAYKAGVLPLALVFLITLCFLAFLSLMVVAAKSKAWGVHLKIALLVMLVLCLAVMGFQLQDIIHVLGSLPAK